jgi:hypothetical protein
VFVLFVCCDVLFVECHRHQYFCLRPHGCHVNSHRYAQSGKAQHNGMAVAPNIMKLGLVVDFLFF